MAGDGSNEYARRVAQGARQRCVGGIMRHAEEQLYPKLTKVEQTALREKVLSSIGAYHDCVLDLLRASVDDGTLKVNEAALEAIARMHKVAGLMERQLSV